MIRASDLSGRAVVDLEAAEKVGTIDRVVLDPDARQVAGFLVARGGKLAGDAMHMTLPAAAVRAIGPDAVTMRTGPVSDEQLARLKNLPSAGDLIGRKVVTEDGRMLGRVTDVVIDRRSGRILGYPIGHGDVLGKVEKLFRGDKHGGQFLNAEAELRAGDDLIIAPEGAVRDQWPTEAESSRETSSAPAADFASAPNASSLAAAVPPPSVDAPAVSAASAEAPLVTASEWRDVPVAPGKSLWVRRDADAPTTPSTSSTPSHGEL